MGSSSLLSLFSPSPYKSPLFSSLPPSSLLFRYVEVAVDYMLNKSITKQYNAFAEGFRILCDGPATRLFNAQVCGQLGVAQQPPRTMPKRGNGGAGSLPV